MEGNIVGSVFCTKALNGGVKSSVLQSTGRCGQRASRASDLLLWGVQNTVCRVNFVHWLAVCGFALGVLLHIYAAVAQAVIRNETAYSVYFTAVRGFISTSACCVQYRATFSSDMCQASNFCIGPLRVLSILRLNPV